MVESCTEGGGEIRYGATPLSQRTELLAELRAELHAELHAELVPFYLQVAIIKNLISEDCYKHHNISDLSHIHITQNGSCLDAVMHG